MRRITSLALGVSLVLGTAVPALGAGPNDSCPASPAGFETVDPDGWWENSLEGFEAEGIAVYVGGDPANGFTAEFDEFATALGFADGQALYEFIVGPQWDTLDQNGDGYVCMKPYPHTPGNPAYLFNGIDNSAH